MGNRSKPKLPKPPKSAEVQPEAVAEDAETEALEALAEDAALDEDEEEPETETDVAPVTPVEPEETAEAGPTMDELYERATQLKIRHRAKMNRAELFEAIQTAELEGNVPVVDESGEDKPVEEKDERQANPEQARKIFSARTEQLEGLLDDPKLPDYLRQLVVAELARRQAAAAAKYNLEKAQGPLDRFKVTKGGRYVTREGFPTFLPAGALVGPTTHDLEDVKRQGIEFEPARVVAVGLDEMGKQVSRIE